MIFKKKFEYYATIDEMPIYNWMKIQETNDLSWILKSKRDLTAKMVPVVQDALQKMTDEYIDTFGISEHYRMILKLKGELACKEIDYLITKDRTNLTFIEIKKKELDIVLRQTNKTNIHGVKIHAEKYMGRAINLKETSVKDFYYILQEMHNQNKAAE